MAFQFLGSESIAVDGAGVAYNSENYNEQVSLNIVPGRHRSYTIHLNAQGIVATTGYMLVDLTDIAHWPHVYGGHITIENLSVNIAPDANFEGNVEIGFLSNVDATNGDFNKLFSWNINTTTPPDVISASYDFDICQIECRADNWFGPTEANDATWQTDVNLVGPPGGAAAYPSGNGDLVMKVTATAGVVDVSVTLNYVTNATSSSSSSSCSSSSCSSSFSSSSSSCSSSSCSSSSCSSSCSSSFSSSSSSSSSCSSSFSSSSSSSCSSSES